MAMKLDAGEVGRGDLYSFYPEFVVVDYEENSRVVPHTAEEIAALAASIKEYGQQQAAVVRRIANNKVQLVAGYGRLQAVALLNRQNPKNKLRLQCKVVDLNAEEAFVRSIIENNDRTATTPTDDAHAQRRLRESFGWSEEKIAAFYKKSVAYIGQLRRVLQLSTPLQAEVAKGNMSVNAALDVVQLPEEERAAVVSLATDPETGKVDTSTIRKKVRAVKITSGKAKARTLQEVRVFFEEQTGPGETKAVRNFSTKFLEFLSGKITDKQMVEALQDLSEGN